MPFFKLNLPFEYVLNSYLSLQLGCKSESSCFSCHDNSFMSETRKNNHQRYYCNERQNWSVSYNRKADLHMTTPDIPAMWVWRKMSWHKSSIATIKGMDARTIFMLLNEILQYNCTSWPEILIIHDIKVTNSGNFSGSNFFWSEVESYYLHMISF